jgi:hypothetical protein
VMTLTPDIEFHEDIRLLIYRPRGLMNEASVNKIVNVIEDLETRLNEPFNRFFDTLGHDEVELNYRYVIQISIHRVFFYGDCPPVKSAILATDSTIVHLASCMPLSLRTRRSGSKYFKHEERPRNGSAFRWNGSVKVPSNGAIKQMVISC